MRVRWKTRVRFRRLVLIQPSSVSTILPEDRLSLSGPMLFQNADDPVFGEPATLYLWSFQLGRCQRHRQRPHHVRSGFSANRARSLFPASPAKTGGGDHQSCPEPARDQSADAGRSARLRQQISRTAWPPPSPSHPPPMRTQPATGGPPKVVQPSFAPIIW